MRRATPWALLLLLVLALVGAGCSTAADNNGGDDDAKQANEDDNVDLTQGGDLTIAVITHGDGGSFWAVAKKGAEDAAKDLGVTLKYSESNNDAAAAGADDRGRGHRQGRRARGLRSRPGRDLERGAPRPSTPASR